MTLRNTVIAFFLILAAVVVTKTNSGSTADPPADDGGGSSSVVLCSLSPQRPAEKNGRLVAAAQFRCVSPGAGTLTMHLHLQRQDGAGWTNVSSNTFAARGAATTREASSAARTRQVDTACAAGTFRTVAEGSAVDGNGTRKLSETSPTRKNPC